VKEIAVSRVKFGYANMANKGACSIRFKYKDSSLAFASSHLDSGIGPGLDTNRRQQLETIIKNSFIYERGTNMLQYNWQSHDIKVIFGDLNFRNTVNLDMDQAMKLISQDDIQTLQGYDEWVQFSKQPKNKKGILRNYREGCITFGPTYKYIVKTDQYDTNRMPAYTDRILFESVHDLPQKNPLMNIYYGKIDYNLSDHKPVTGLFEAKIKVVNAAMK